MRNMHHILFDFISKYFLLSQGDKCAVEALYSIHTLKKGKVFLQEGQYSRESYIILKGCIRTYYIINGEEKTTGFYSEMNAFTPTCVLNKQPSGYFISCVEDSVVTVLNSNLAADIFKNYPKLESFNRVLSEELLAKSQYSFDQFKTSSPERRYLSLIKNRPDLLKRVPQHQLASYLGIKPQSLSRIRSRIMKENRKKSKLVTLVNDL